ncbi:MAG TPA: glycoside hydrolase family 172 protein [Spirochaetota bacterium]|nr:glycoside hydrolase family 172 protein [Spirochaetota bacterium]
MDTFNGLGMNMGNLCRLSGAQSRSISAENFTGAKGKGGMATEGCASYQSEKLGRGWKVSPAVKIASGKTFTLADIKGPGAVQQIWMTLTGRWRHSILRIYWDEQEQPSVECPAGDFFCAGWGKYSQLSSLAVCLNPGSSFNCYWEMPFRKRCRITIENRSEIEITCFYQINYALTDIPADCAYFHASFRRLNPVPARQVYPLIDGIRGRGHYVGTYVAWGVNNNGWWGEGELKFYIDDDKWPTICGTGTEDYFGGSYNFENQETNQYQEFTTPYTGMHQVIRPDGLYNSQQRFGMYRWHITDPIRFKHDLRITMQDLGWGHDKRYRAQQSDIASVAYWYQTLPTAPLQPLPDKEYLEVV